MVVPWPLYLAAAQLLCAVGTAAGSSVKTTQAVVLVVADDLGYADLGYTGSQIETPVLDHLALNGVRLRNYYVQRACSPTRAALQTGRYNIRMGFASGVMKPLKPYCLPLNETLLPQYLNSLGFTSHAVGKWHLGYYKWACTPTHRGFSSFYGYYTGGEDYYTHTSSGGLDFRLDPVSNTSAVQTQLLFAER